MGLGRRAPAIVTSSLLALLLLVQPVGAQDGCREPEKNMQCAEFGTIQMDSQRDIRGEAIDLSASITLNTAFADQGARWLLFSVRNVTQDGSNPVTIVLTRFATSSGDVVTTRIEQAGAHELNLWVDVLDTPVGDPITIDLRVGATERGAYRLETLVMAFDRGYAPIRDSYGYDASLFSFTLLGVNRETAGAAAQGEGWLVGGNKIPGFEMVAAVAALAVAAVVLVRRRTA